MPAETDPFEEHLARWQDYTEQPWARLRYAVVADVLARHLAGRGEGLRVLDVGGGDGLDSLPLARAGHDVTILDTAPGMLAAARSRAESAGVRQRVTTLTASLDDLGAAGAFDVVLCHFVLHYRPAAEQEADLARLVAALAPGGLLSVVAPNPAARVLATVVRQGPAAAREVLHEEGWESATFAHHGRLLPAEAVLEDLDRTGARVVGRYGGRIANDLLVDDDAKHDPAYFDALLRLELELCDREPYCRVGTYWQVVAELGPESD